MTVNQRPLIVPIHLWVSDLPKCIEFHVQFYVSSVLVCRVPGEKLELVSYKWLIVL